MCRVFGHIPAMECPKGVQFDEWSPEEVVHTLGADPLKVLNGRPERFVPTEFIMAAVLGSDLGRALKRSRGGIVSLDVRTLPASEYRRILDELQP